MPTSTANPFPRPVPPELRDHPHYEVLRELGRGGMGVVYLARNRLMDRLEALKVLNKALLDQPGATERFLREVRAAARLDHPHIVKAHAALQLGELLVFVMEYVEGEDLAQVVAAQGPLPVALACSFARQAALALQHAHEQGMVHRDVKPHNLILARSGGGQAIKVLDFGLAKATREHEETAHHLTGTGALLGTPDYMAPEQTLDAGKADVRADVYSLGCALYFLLAGRPPFQARSRFELLQAHQSAEAAPLDRVRADVPAGLAAVVARMMAKDPARRFQQPLEVAQALAPFLEAGAGPLPAGPAQASKVAGPGLTADTTKEAPQWDDRGAGAPVLRATLIEASAPARPAGGGRSRRWLLGAGIGVALLALAIGLGFRLTRPTPDGGQPPETTGLDQSAILVVQVNEPSPDVYVDGGKVAVTWEDGGKTAVIRLRPGTRKVEVKKEGLSAFGEEVDVQPGQHRVVTVRLVRPAPALDSTEAYDPTGGARFVHFGRGRPRVVLRYNDDGKRGDGKRVPELYFVRVYDLETGTPVTPPLRVDRPVAQATFSTDGKLLVVSGRGDGTSPSEVRVWSTGTENLLFPPLKIGKLPWCAFSFDGKRLGTINSSNEDEGKGRRLSRARLWDTTTGKELTPGIEIKLSVPTAVSTCRCFSPDGKRVVIGEWIPYGDQGSARVWDAETGQALTPPLHDRTVLDAKFSPDGKRVVTVSRRSARIWDAASGKELTPPIEEDLGALSRARFSPDGQRVVTVVGGDALRRGGGMIDKSVRVWDAATGQDVTPWLQHPNSTGGLYATFSSDSKRVVTAGNGKAKEPTTRVWDAATGAELTPPLRHEGLVLRAMFSPDGKRVVTLSQRYLSPGPEWQIAQLWDVQSGKELKKVMISPD
jgi:WD40 repeat protein